MPVDEFEAVRQLFAEEAHPDAKSWATLWSRLEAARADELCESPRVSAWRAAQRALNRRRTQLVLGAVTLTVVATVTVAALAASHSSAPRPTRPTSQTGPAPVRPLRIRLVSSGGMEVSVPSSWRLNDQNCGTPLGDTVLFSDGDAGVATCEIVERPRLTVVDFQELGYIRRLGWDKVAKHRVKLGGKWLTEAWLPASRQNHRLLVLTAPGLPTALTVQSPRAVTAAQLASTVRLVAVDANGCASHARRLEPPSPSPRQGSADALVPGDPTAASICAYSRSWLYNSRRVARSSLASLIKVINGLPDGSDQLDNRGQLRTTGNCTSEAEDFSVVRFAYASGPPELVYVHPSGCAPLPASVRPAITNLSASNGSRSGRIEWGLITALRYPFGFPNPTGLKPNPS